MTGIKTKALLAVAAIVLLWLAADRLDGLVEENERLRHNQEQLLGKTVVEYRTTDDGKAVAETQALDLKVKELKAGNDSLLRVVRQLGIRNRRLTALAQAATATRAAITSPLHDSIIPRPTGCDSIRTGTDTLRCLSYSDPWITLSGCIRADTFSGTIESRDTLDLIVHRVPRRFLFLRFGCKAVRMDVVSHNRHSRIAHARYVRLSK